MADLHTFEDLTSKITGANTLKEQTLLYNLAKQTRGGAIVEIGSWKGKSIVWLAQGSKDGSGAKVYAIDPFIGAIKNYENGVRKDIPVSVLGDFKQALKIAKCEDIVEPIVMKSEEAIKGWNKPIGLIFIDGDHSYGAVKQDFELWSPFLVDGGIIAFHDVACDIMTIRNKVLLLGEKGVRRFAKEFLCRKDYKQFRTVSTILYATKGKRDWSAWQVKLKMLGQNLVYFGYISVRGVYHLVRKAL